MSALGPIELLFLLAPLVVVPLARRLIAAAGEATAALSAARRLQPPAAACVVASFLLPHRGWAAAGLALPWLVLTALVAWQGALRLWTRARDAAEIATAAGCAMLPVGGGWLVLSRLGVHPLGFEEPIPLLTAVHFHYAAFAALVLVGRAGREAGGGRVYPSIVAGAIAGPPLLAAGITLSPLLEVVAASLVVAALSGLAVLTLARIVPRHRGPDGVLLAVSSLSILAGMGLALAYAIGEFTGIGIISLGRMARIHGPLNGLGFALCGLLGWTWAARNSHPPSL